MDTESTDVNIQKYGPLGKLFSALGSEKRLKAFILLSFSYQPTQVVDEIEISRSGLQNYINDFKRLELFEKQGKSLVTTDTGEWVREELAEMEDGYSEFLQSELMEDFQGIGGFASPGGRQFVQQLFEEHPEEARRILKQHDVDINDLSDTDA